jgi:hypothetical protein
LCLEALEDRFLPSITVQFDFSYDSSGFFNDPVRRASLNQAASLIGNHFSDSLSAIIPDPNVGNTGTAFFVDPAVGSRAIQNLVVPANTLIVYAFGEPLTGSEAGEGGPGGYSASGSQAWLNTVETRGHAGFSPWGGSVMFDTSTNWYFGSDPAGIAPAQVDFFTVAEHEIGHLFGFGIADSFKSHISNGQFTGVNAVALYGGNVPLDPNSNFSHWAENVTDMGSGAVMVPVLPEGTRRLFTALDFAALNDIGWTTATQASGILQFSAPSYTAAEDQQSVTLTVTRTGSTAGTIAVQYATSDGAARAGTDYIPVSGTLTFADGVASQVIVVSLFDDHAIGEGAETFQLTLVNPSGGAMLGSTSTAQISIAEDDVPGVSSTWLALGADAGGGPEVRVVHGLGENIVQDFYAYDPRFLGGVRVAIGDVISPGVPDIVTAPGPGGGPDVRVFDLSSGRLVREFMAYSPFFNGGVFVAVADVNGDGYADIITGADYGGGPHVKVFSGKDQSLLYSFMAYDPRFFGGVRVAAGDVDGDGRADIITAPGPGGGPDIRVYSGADGHLIREFMAYDYRFSGGVYVSAGDFNNDGKMDIVTAAGAGGEPQVEVFSGADGALLKSFMAFGAGYGAGVRVAVIGDANGDGVPEIVVATGPSWSPEVRVFDGAGLAMLDDFYAFDPRFLGGVFVGGE